MNNNSGHAFLWFNGVEYIEIYNHLNMQIDKIITDYVLFKDTDYAIMINGEWGAGKSWYWDNVLTEQIKVIPTKDSTEEKPSMYKVAKISLFGISWSLLTVCEID